MNRGGVRLVLAIVVCLVAAPVTAQVPGSTRTDEPANATTPVTTPSTDLPMVTEYDADLLRDLPVSDNLFSVLEAMQPSVISDRFTGGGLYAGQPARIGGFLSSWTETLFTVDGVPISDPNLTGAPLIIPDAETWSSIRVFTGGTSSPGRLTIDLRPPTAGPRWTRTVQAATSHGALTASAPAAGAPPIAALAGYDHVAIAASGPLKQNRLGASVAGSWTRGSQFDRGNSDRTSSSSASAFSHLTFTPNDRDDVRLVGWVQRRTSPFAPLATFNQSHTPLAETSGHTQATWNHRRTPARFVRAAASYSGRRSVPAIDTRAPVVFEALTDGPPSQLSGAARNTTQLWSLETMVGSLSVTRRLLRTVTGTVEATGGRAESSAFFTGIAGETVNGIPARLWSFTAPATASVRHNLIVAASASAMLVALPRLTINTGVTVQSTRGNAEGSSSRIAWRAVLPRVDAMVPLLRRGEVTLFGGYSRSMLRLGLDDLAIGDPAAPTADVYRWTATGSRAPSLVDRGALISRVGPGTAGQTGFTTIDPALEPPISNEIVAGVQARRRGVLLRLTGVSRREHHLLAIANTGAPFATSYSVFTVRDPGGDVLSPEDDQVLPVYNRLPASFARDQYVLTNSTADATFNGIELTIHMTTRRLTVIGGATAGRAEAQAQSRGYGPLQNDQTVSGELLIDPNASTLARGRPFTDRAYTAKFAAVYRFPHDVRLGAIARYQDGQPFSRVLVFPDLNQGAEAVRAFANGESRFLFVATLDTRLQKGITLGGRRVDLFLDAYNVTNLANSVEENVAAAPDVRIATALQPPRTFHLGFRLSF